VSGARDDAPEPCLARALRAGLTAGLSFGVLAGLGAAGLVALAPGVLRPAGSASAWLPLHHGSLLAALGVLVGLAGGALLRRCRRPLPTALAAGLIAVFMAPLALIANVRWLPEVSHPRSIAANVALVVVAGLAVAIIRAALGRWPVEPPGGVGLVIASVVVAAPFVVVALFGEEAVARVDMTVTELAPDPPSTLILVTIDTLRADHLGCYGYVRDTSPRIDRLAGEGVVYERAFSHAPNTHPSLATIMTGEPLAAFDHLALKDFVAPGTETLAERMRRRGYRSIGVVSNPHLKREMGFGQGFDRYDDRTAMVLGAERVTDAALAATADETGPLFLWVHYLDPHHPYIPPPDADRFGPPVASVARLQRRADLSDRLRAAASGDDPLSEPEWRRLVDLYDGEIWHTDREIGRLLDGLAARGRLGDARIVVTSDHGEEFRDHGGVLHSHTLYAELVRLPLIVWSSRRPPARRDRRLLAARSVEALLLGHEVPAATSVIAEKLHEAPGLTPPLVSVRTASWTLVSAAYRPQIFTLRPARIARSLRELVLFAPVAMRSELYAAGDVAEQRDLADMTPRVRRSLEDELRRRYRMRRVRAGSGGLPSAETMEQLEALGYLGR